MLYYQVIFLVSRRLCLEILVILPLKQIIHSQVIYFYIQIHSQQSITIQLVGVQNIMTTAIQIQIYEIEEVRDEMLDKELLNLPLIQMTLQLLLSLLRIYYHLFQIMKLYLKIGKYLVKHLV